MSVLDEWIEQAEADYKGAVALRRRRRDPLPGLVCFHCQQCAEKYLKAFLVAQGVAPPRTHDLLYLLSEASAHDARLGVFAPECALLNPYAVAARYPGLITSTADAADALRAARRLRSALRRRLGL